MPARESVVTHARTARFLAFLTCILPASAWAAYQTQYISFFGELLPLALRPEVGVPLAEWLTGGTAVMLAVAAFLVLRSKSLHQRRRLGGLLALGSVTALVGASGLHLASEAQATPPPYFVHNIVKFGCVHNTVFSADDCFNGISIPDQQDPDPALDPDLIILENPYNQPVRILQLALKDPDPASGDTSVHFVPTGQTCFAGDVLPPAELDTACIEGFSGGAKTCFNSTVVLQPGATCNVLVADNPPPN